MIDHAAFTKHVVKQLAWTTIIMAVVTHFAAHKWPCDDPVQEAIQDAAAQPWFDQPLERR